MMNASYAARVSRCAEPCWNTIIGKPCDASRSPATVCTIHLLIHEKWFLIRAGYSAMSLPLNLYPMNLQLRHLQEAAEPSHRDSEKQS
jgi:hypothetical protein